jgi:hypothetical protein
VLPQVLSLAFLVVGTSTALLIPIMLYVCECALFVLIAVIQSAA